MHSFMHMLCTLFPGSFGISVVILVQLLFRKSCWWDFTGVASETGRHNLTGHFPVFRPFQSFCPLFCSVPWANRMGVLCRCICWDCYPQLCILIGCGCLWWSTSVVNTTFIDDIGGLQYFLNVAYKKKARNRRHLLVWKARTFQHIIQYLQKSCLKSSIVVRIYLKTAAHVDSGMAEWIQAVMDPTSTRSNCDRYLFTHARPLGPCKESL